MSERILTKCPKCKTRTLVREGQELVCTECKGRFDAPEPPPPPDPPRHARHHMTGEEVREKHKFYEDNKKKILADLRHIGATAVVKKWGIPYATISTLKRRWLGKNRNRPTQWAKHRYYEDHKDQILRDLHTLGRKPTKEKWKMPPSTLQTLLTRWGVDPLEERPSVANHPLLPPWNDNWDKEVQVKWLDTYGKIYGGEK